MNDLLREARETLAWHALYNATLAPGSSALIARIDAYLAQPAASEPVATLYQHSEDGRTMVVMRGNVLAAPGQYQPVGELFLHPPAAPRTLTDEEIIDLWSPHPGGSVRRPVLGRNKIISFARAVIEATKDQL